MRIFVAIPSRSSSGFLQLQTQKYDWRTFILKSFHGLLTVAGYLVASVEMPMLIGLNRLGKLTTLSPDDLSRDDAKYDVLLEPTSSSEDRQW